MSTYLSILAMTVEVALFQRPTVWHPTIASCPSSTSMDPPRTLPAKPGQLLEDTLLHVFEDARQLVKKWIPEILHLSACFLTSCRDESKPRRTSPVGLGLPMGYLPCILPPTSASFVWWKISPSLRTF